MMGGPAELIPYRLKSSLAKLVHFPHSKLSKRVHFRGRAHWIFQCSLCQIGKCSPFHKNIDGQFEPRLHMVSFHEVGDSKAYNKGR